MKKRFLMVFVLLNMAFYANAGWLDDQVDKIKDRGRDEIKEKVTEQLDRYCFKLPVINYYICPPLSPDFVNNI